MSKPFDSTLKQLFDAFGADWVRWLAPEFRIPADVGVEPVDADLSTVQLSADKVFRLRPAQFGLIHFEPQSSHDVELPDRMLAYNALLKRRHGGPVRSVAVLLRPEANASTLTGELTGTYADGEEYLRFRYGVIRVWQLPLEPLLTGTLGVLPLALLTDAAADQLRQVVDRIDQRLRAERTPDPVRLLLHTCGYLLLGMRYDEVRITQAFLGVEGMKESTTYQAILQEGRAEGRAEGQIETLRRNLRNVLIKRFSGIPAELDGRIAANTDPAKLEDALLQAISIDTPDHLTL